MSLTIGEKQEGLFPVYVGEWSVSFTDSSYNDHGGVEVPVTTQTGSIGFTLWTSRKCQGGFSVPALISLVAVVKIADDTMTGTLEELGCAFPYPQGQLNLRRN